jgi:glyoxylase-like metal-dependent hydrolase (beta-lactamase superfamily II)
MKLFPGLSAALGLAVLAPAAVAAEEAVEAKTTMNEVEVTVRADHVAGSVWVIQGRGGHIGLSVGDDGAFMIDDQYAPLTPTILEVVGRITDQPVRFVVNTHWHGDHVGGNERLGATGSVIVAHDNVRKRVSTEQFMELFQRTVPPLPDAALPVITFADGLTFHLNNDTIRVKHLANAHTDGDAVVYFEEADVIHMGDIFWNGVYPLIDVGAGGSSRGLVAAVDAVLPMISDDTRIIAGHGPAVASRADLVAFRDVVAAITDRVQAGIDAGRSLEEIQASKPTADWDETWGQGFIKPDTFVQIVYGGLAE